jgi:hypothetical protein
MELALFNLYPDPVSASASGSATLNGTLFNLYPDPVSASRSATLNGTVFNLYTDPVSASGSATLIRTLFKLYPDPVSASGSATLQFLRPRITKKKLNLRSDIARQLKSFAYTKETLPALNVTKIRGDNP